MRGAKSSLFLAAVLGMSCAPAGDGEPGPNVIFILADDLGYGELGCQGQQWIRTPNIDQLAAEGLRFTQHYAGNAVCAPSRCCLLTGKHPGHATIRDNSDPPDRVGRAEDGFFPGQLPIPDAEVTVAELLREAGYATAAIGKWGLGFEGSTGDPNRQGFDLFYGYLCQRHAHNHYPRYLFRNGEKEWLAGNERGATGEVHSQERFTEVALEFIRENRERPFFLYLPLAIPHLSIQTPEDCLAWYEGEIPEEEHDDGGYYIAHRSPRAGYAAMVTQMDRDVGRILDLLRELGLEEDTLVFFSSDNGPTFERLGGADSDFFASAGPLKGRKGSLDEGGIRVPLIARWPGRVPRGATSEHVSAAWDVLPTLCEIAGARVPEGVDGISFAPTLFGEEGQRRHPYLYWEFPGYGGQQALRLDDWKAVRRGMRSGSRAIELYDLGSDVGETRDLAEREPELVARIERLMREARQPSELFPHPVDGEPPR